MEVTSYSEMLVLVYQTTQFQNHKTVILIFTPMRTQISWFLNNVVSFATVSVE